MKKAFILLIFTAATLFAQTNEGPIITAIDGYAARVNNQIITYGDIRENLAPIVPQLFQKYQGDELAQRIQQLHFEGRETLIEEALLQEEAKSRGLSLPPEVINQEVDNIIRDRFDNNRVMFNQALAARRMTYDEWRQEISDKLTMRVFYNQEVLRNIHVDENDIQAEYDRIKETMAIPFRVKYRFILINKGTTEEEQTVKRKQAEDTLQKLRTGAGFATLSEEVSEGDISLSPWRNPADVKQILRPALEKTPAGGISDLIESDSVFYIVKVESRQEEGYTPLDEVREAIQQNLRAQEQNQLHQQLIERLSAKHYIERY